MLSFVSLSASNQFSAIPTTAMFYLRLEMDGQPRPHLSPPPKMEDDT